MSEFIHITPQKAARRKAMQVTEGSNNWRPGKDKILIKLWIVGHLRKNADAQPQAHIGFDHIRIGSSQHNAWRQPRIGKGLVRRLRPHSARR